MIRHLKVAALAAALVAGAAAAQQTTNPPVMYPTKSGNFAAPGSATGIVGADGKFVPDAPATYAAAIVNQANSSAGDLMCVSGSATKTVWVKKFRVSAVASAAVVADISVVKRSTADTGGTPTSLTLVPLDSAEAAATAAVTTYATAPTAGTLVGAIRAQALPVATSTSPNLAPVPTLFDFATYHDQPVVLHGTAENVCLLVSATAGGQWHLDVEWTEQ